MAAQAGHAGAAAGRVVGAGPNMTPMVDVVMCILIFFMLGSVFLNERFLVSDVHPALGGSTVDRELKLPPVRSQITLVRRGDDTWVSAFGGDLLQMNRRNDRDQSLNEKIAALFSEKSRTLSPDVQIIIQPGKGVPWQDVISVYDSCIKAQFKQVAFAPAN
jgi:biopolymer transport protein ExbD